MNPLLKQFVEETRECLEDAASGLLVLERDPTDRHAMDQVFRAMHSTKGGSGLFDFDPMTELMHQAENLLDEVRQGESLLPGALVGQLSEVLDQVNRWIDVIERDEALPPDAACDSQALIERLRQTTGEDVVSAIDQQAVRAVMQEQLAMLAAVDADDETAAGRVASASRVLKRGLLALGKADDAIDAALEKAASGDLERELKERFDVISRIAQDMQDADRQVQMLPMAQIFQRFPRLVRDLSRRQDKQVELVQEGEHTEADKTVIEVLGEPLTHMVRNSIDHGIELPAARQAAGKPAQGTIRLAARQEGEHVIVEVEDDGGGLDPDALRRKAVDKVLISQAEADRLTDQESLQLIFIAGFSTRDAVSDLSGRGVGMDVVRSTVNRYGGSVSVASEQGRGTRLRLVMPLTMAVSYVMGVEVAGQLFGVPMESVVETVQLPESAVRQVKQEEAVVLRDEVIPLRRLDQLLMLDASGGDSRARVNATYDNAQVTVLVVRQPEGPVGLVVDDFQEGLDVIVKPMAGTLASIPAYSGTALLGDGRVLLVLNLRELL